MGAKDAKNYYEMLGVSRKATKEEIKAAYREIALVYHPDSNFFSEIVSAGLTDRQHEIFRNITAAYHTLINVKSRAEYDEKLPPDLRGWGETSASERQLQQSEEEKINFAQKAPAMGIFGSAPLDNDYEDEELPPAKPPGFMDRLRTILGF